MVYHGAMSNRALVLGGGGVTGAAWELGLIAGLAGLDVDLTQADLVIGTSAGAVVGAQVRSGVPLEPMYQRQLAPPAGEIPARLGAMVIAKMAWIMLTSRDQVRGRARLGAMALRAGTVPEADCRQVFQARLPSADWPDRPLQVTAIDAHTGDFVVFDAASEASLVDAVGASCAVPGVWPPVTIGRRRFIDGGMRSPANADLAAGHDRVVIIAPLGRGSPRIPGPQAQAAELRAAGAQVVVVTPDAAARTAIGHDVLDLGRRSAAARAGRDQADGAAAAVRMVWAD
jgi:NTE family protein